MNAQRKAGEDLFDQADERFSEESVRHPGLYVIADVVLLCALAALVYGLVKLI